MAEDYEPDLARLTGAPPGAYDVVHYGPGADQFGEFWPAGGPGDAALMVLVHGGFWRARYRLDLMHHLALDLRSRGYSVWNVEYRRLGSLGGGWPGTFLDVAAALDAVADRAADWAVDPDRVVVLGHSAGGALALWAAAQAGPPPSLAVSLAGVCDLDAAAEQHVGDGVLGELLGGRPDQVPQAYELANPARLVPIGVPQLIVHGTADKDVPYSLSESYAAAAGAEATLLTLPGVEHVPVIDPSTPAWSAIADELQARVPAGP